MVAGTAVLGLGLFTGSGLLLGGYALFALFALSPFSMLGVAALVAWQWQLSGMSRSGRVLLAAVAVGVYTSAALVIFLMQSGFID